MVMFNYQGNRRIDLDSMGGARPTPMGGAQPSGRSIQDLIKGTPAQGQSFTSDAEAAKARATGLYDTPEYQTRMFGGGPGTKVVDGKIVPETYGTDPSSLSKTKTTPSGSSGGGSFGGGGVVSTGSGTSTGSLDLGAVQSQISEWNKGIEEARNFSLGNWETAITNYENEIAQLESSPLIQSLRSASQEPLSGGLTESQKAGIGSEMRGISQRIGESALASGFQGSGRAGAEIAGAQGEVAARTADIIRQNRLQGISAGLGVETGIRGIKGDLMRTLETEIRPAELQLPDYAQQAELLGRATAQSGGAGGAGGTTWRQVGDYDVTKGGRQYEQVTHEMLAEEKRLAGMTQQERLAEKRRLYQEDLARRRAASRG